jgi:hypothetical protein
LNLQQHVDSTRKHLALLSPAVSAMLCAWQLVVLMPGNMSFPACHNLKMA